ncbi:MAG TPA: hypothetical protein VFN10_18135 [Thermoanaerobaculia bacterium]|nr:hypothetical protein [Thermoanaerobaculia bacterium]
MWRWVTRCLVLSAIAALLTPALFAQQFYAQLDSPDPAVTQNGMILVKGWALDPGLVTKVELYVDDQFQHTAVLNLPRIDIVEAFPTYPGIHQARPGFVTGFLASRFTNGNHTVEVRVYTSDGQVRPVGRRTITINNTINQAPFGSVDIPDAAGVHNATGSFPVNGWAADTDGVSRVDVLIDGGVMQSAVYGDPRPDVGASFPDYPNAQFSGFVAHVDTTRVQNGVHLLEIRATDTLGMSKMIGRRQIQILNNDSFLRPFGYLDEPKRDAVLFGTECGTGGGQNFSPPINPQAHITPVRGWALDLGTREDVGRVSYVELLVDGVRWLSSDDCGQVFGELANCYGLPRYDVARYYPTYPDSPRAGFFFTLDVGTLMNMGVRPGNHNLRVRVGDREQTFADLPNRDGIPVFFQCVEASFDLPSFGFIDFPHTFDYVGGVVTFHGWAIDENTLAAVEIVIDGNFVGTAQYGFSRPDVRQQYPQFTFDTGWRFTMDTRLLSNARHRMTVRTLDARGHRVEIGSVDFYVSNNTPAP